MKRRTALDGLVTGRLEVIADADTAAVKAALSADPTILYPELAAASRRTVCMRLVGARAGRGAAALA